MDASARRNQSGSETREGPGRYGIFVIVIWTFFLLDPLHAGWLERDEVTGWIGMATTIAFGVWYVGAILLLRRGMFDGSARRGPTPTVIAIVVAILLALVVCWAVGQPGSSTAVYISVMCIMSVARPWGVVLALVNAAAWYVAGFVVPDWDRDNTLLLSLLTASLAVFGIQQVMLGNVRLRAANQENQRLAVAEERNRFARDLHDILGHSLTVITVKAELAQRVLDSDPARAKAEIADLERLSRDALADVRRAVEGYRELTLPGELTRARMALAAAQIEADLPNSTEVVPSDLRELFAWTIREGVTNVIRHSGASRCTVRLTPTRVQVSDDGCGPVDHDAGTGLIGLRERASAVGATVVTGPAQPQGYTLEVLAS